MIEFVLTGANPEDYSKGAKNLPWMSICWMPQLKLLEVKMSIDYPPMIHIYYQAPSRNAVTGISLPYI